MLAKVCPECGGSLSLIQLQKTLFVEDVVFMHPGKNSTNCKKN